MDTHLAQQTLSPSGLLQFQELRTDAVNAVSDRFYRGHDAPFRSFGPRGRDACRDDLAFHLEFLRPVLEFGALQPMVDYLVWLNSVLSARGIRAEHLALSLDWLGEFFAERMSVEDGAIVANTLDLAKKRFLAAPYGDASTSTAQAEPWPELQSFETALLLGRQHEASTIVN